MAAAGEDRPHLPWGLSPPVHSSVPPRSTTPSSSYSHYTGSGKEESVHLSVCCQCKVELRKPKEGCVSGRGVSVGGVCQWEGCVSGRDSKINETKFTSQKLNYQLHSEMIW